VEDSSGKEKPMRWALLAVLAGALVLVGVAAVAAEPDEPFIQARVTFSSPTEMEQFLSLPGLDVMRAKPGVGVTIVTDAGQIEELRALGYDVAVEIDDMQHHYAAEMRGRDDFGDYHTYAEMVQALDDLHAAYPSITTEKFSIATTWESRTVWAIKISDNPDIDESEPEVLFDGMHHARECIGMEAILHYMTWLCENYGSDPEATFLVDNREIFFVPIVNPDGYVYNETQYGWGGMWRKNRRDNPGSCEGVDPNRNYDANFGGVGSSGDYCDETYHGPSVESEPEVAGYTSFVGDHEFVTNISFHSVASLILLPWGYTYTHTPDDALFREIGNILSESNGYPVGQAGELLYLASGTTTDWLYGAHGVFSYTIEIGGTGFWPNESELPGLVEENLWPQRVMTRIAGDYLAVESTALTGGDEDGKPDAGETLDLTVTIENQALTGAVGNAQVQIVTNDPYVQFHDASSSLGNIPARSSASNAADPFSFTVDASTPDAHGLTITLVITGDGFYAEEPLRWMVGEPVVLFADDMENGTGNWVENDGRWGLTTTNFHSPSTSYTDSPSGNYGNYWDTWIELATPLDLSHASAAELSFWHRVDTEEDYDFCYVEASSDGGASWHQVGPKYDGNVNWQFTELDVSDYAGTAGFKVRFRLVTDTYVTEDGWYVDDVAISGPAMGNAPPSAPTLLDPPDGGSASSMPTLIVTNATDPDPGDVLTYGFAVYADALRTDPVASVSGVAEGSGSTSWTVGTALAPGTYWWDAYADDGSERGPLMDLASFDVETSGVDGAPAEAALHPARPNPFRGSTELAFELPTRSEVSLAIYAVDGRLVRTLARGEAGPGPVSVTWDGRDETGRVVGSGLYFARLVAGDRILRTKVALIR
jgi:carboxypeptidase T